VCCAPLINPLALAIFEKFIEIAVLVEAADGEMIPYDPFPKANYWAVDDIPVVAIEGFKIIQQAMGMILKIKRKKTETKYKHTMSVRGK